MSRRRKPIRSRRGSQFMAPAPPRSEERALREFLQFMSETIATRFESNLIEGLNQSTVEKFAGGFEDAQTGNWGAIARKITRRVTRMIKRQFGYSRLDRQAEAILARANKRNRDALYNSLERRIGVDRSKLISQEALTSESQAHVETAQVWIRKLRDETLEKFSTESIQAMSEGQSLDELLERFKDLKEERLGHAEYLARNQIQNYNSAMTRLRSESLGIIEAVWVTQSDGERVRKCHQARHGEKFRLADGLYSACDKKTLWPGMDHNCRCGYRLIVPQEDE